MIDRIRIKKVEIDLSGSVPSITTQFDLEDSERKAQFPLSAPTHHGRAKTIEKAQELVAILQQELEELILERPAPPLEKVAPPSKGEVTW